MYGAADLCRMQIRPCEIVAIAEHCEAIPLRRTGDTSKAAGIAKTWSIQQELPPAARRFH
jgi:hypothetical protein